MTGMMKNILEKEYKATIRYATVADFKAWAYSTTLKRASVGDYVYELSANGQVRVYVLEKIKAGSNQVVGVCEQPSQELLAMIDSNPLE